MSSTIFRSTRARVLTACAAAAVAVPLALAAPAGAGVDMDNPVVGLPGCEVATGAPIITWTLTNNVNEVVDIDSATLSGALTGSVPLLPNPIDPDGTATATTVAPVGTTGSVTITVVTSWVDGEFPMDDTSTVTVALGTCVVPSTTTTSTSTTLATTTTTAPTTTTTARPAAVAVVVATPRFTG